ncbi:MAG TPA: hypothetical protein VK599_21240, partial [Streptosporangiaceae bacterium]|nr:hypothetical protein [Streptosporangiaceae bacterium]
VYSPADKALWSSGTGSPGSFLQVQADGNVVVYDSADKALWDRSMFISAVPASTVIASGDEVVSPSRNYELRMQADGNLVLYPAGSAKPVWATGTASPGAFAQMQGDGNFVVYSPADKALWSSGTGSPGSFLQVQADGNVVVYDSADKALWSRTGGLVR